jgi:hypothetical protein
MSLTKQVLFRNFAALTAAIEAGETVYIRPINLYGWVLPEKTLPTKDYRIVSVDADLMHLVDADGNQETIPTNAQWRFDFHLTTALYKDYEVLYMLNPHGVKF